MQTPSLFVASSGQNVGKTTTCLGLIAGLRKRKVSVGFIKPVGQQYVETEGGIRADKDVVLFKEHFHFPERFETMSPVLIPRGFTKQYLDGNVSSSALSQSIKSAYDRISEGKACNVIEGTGHVGVGSIIDLNNAKVASMLSSDMLLILSGGLGASFDALMLNKSLCDSYGVRIRGVILNKVLPEKYDMIKAYFTKALKPLNIPLLGCIPYVPLLSENSMLDFSLHLGASFLSGRDKALHHFADIQLIATSLERFKTLIEPKQLIITPAIREDILWAVLAKFWDASIKRELFEVGLILTGGVEPSQKILSELQKAGIPTIYTQESSYEVMRKISTHTAKIRGEDLEKIQKAIAITETNIDFSRLTQAFDL